MRITVLGGTGRTGAPLVAEALKRGHHVTVLARDRTKAHRRLPASNERLTILEGDATDADAVDRAVAGAEAVIDVTGPVKNGPKDLRSRVTRALLPAMQRHDVKRLVFLTGAGVRVAGDRPKLADRAFRGAIRLLQPKILKDAQAAVAAVTSSPLNWTVVRAPRLTDGKRSGEVRAAGHVGDDTGTALGRSDLVEFILDELEDDDWSRQAPIVSW